MSSGTGTLVRRIGGVVPRHRIIHRTTSIEVEIPNPELPALLVRPGVGWADTRFQTNRPRPKRRRSPPGVISNVEIGTPTPAQHDAEAVLQAVASISVEAGVLANAETLLQIVATMVGDSTAVIEAEAALQGVVTFDADGSAAVSAEAVLQAVAEMVAEGDLAHVTHDAEALLQGVAHMGFDPDVINPPVSWFRLGRGTLFPAEMGNRRRVRGSRETTGRRIF